MSSSQGVTCLIVLQSLAAEGTPRMAVELCRHWLQAGVRPALAVLSSSHLDLQAEFDQLGVEIHWLEMPERGYGRYFRLIRQVARLVRKRRAVAVLSMPFGWHSFIAIGARAGGARRVVAHVGNHPGGQTLRD